MSTPFYPQIKIKGVQVKIKRLQIKITGYQIKITGYQIKIRGHQIKIRGLQIKIKGIQIKTYLRISLSLYLRCFLLFIASASGQVFRRQDVSTHITRFIIVIWKTALNLQLSSKAENSMSTCPCGLSIDQTFNITGNFAKHITGNFAKHHTRLDGSSSLRLIAAWTRSASRHGTNSSRAAHCTISSRASSASPRQLAKFHFFIVLMSFHEALQFSTVTNALFFSPNINMRYALCRTAGQHLGCGSVVGSTRSFQMTVLNWYVWRHLVV